jgi:hypothetical protein
MSLLQARACSQMLAEKSGGEAWFPNQWGAYFDVIKGILQDMAKQYRLVYAPHGRADGKLHKIKVEAFQITNDKPRDFKIRVRDGWRV